jgi:hypothetical protein
MRSREKLPKTQASVLASNEQRIGERVELILQTGKRAVSLLGLSYKVETDDFRSSPYLELCRRLLAKGVDLRVFDPLLLGQPRRSVSTLGVPAELVVDTLDEALTHGDLMWSERLITPSSTFVAGSRRHSRSLTLPAARWRHPPARPSRRLHAASPRNPLRVKGPVASGQIPRSRRSPARTRSARRSRRCGKADRRAGSRWSPAR